MLGRARVLQVLRALLADACQGALDYAHHLGHGDLLGCAGEPVSALRPTLALDDASVLELGEDGLEELDRDRLGAGDLVALQRGAFVGRELQECPYRVVGLGRYPHRATIWAAKRSALAQVLATVGV